MIKRAGWGFILPEYVERKHERGETHTNVPIDVAHGGRKQVE